MTTQLMVNFNIVKKDWGKLSGFGLYFYLANKVWNIIGNNKAELSILMTDGNEMRILNKKWRNEDLETNVLAFPNANKELFHKLKYIGDISIGYEVVVQEANAKNISIINHTAHLVVHGILHLLGYTHENAENTLKMQKIEIKVLKEVGISNPYIY